MGCQCQKPDFFNDEIIASDKKKIKDIENNNEYKINNNLNSIFNKFLGNKAEPTDEFSKYVFTQINKLRENPQSFIDSIKSAKKNIKIDKSGVKIYKTTVKVALFKAEKAFDEAIEFLKKTKPMNKLIFNPDFVIKVPNTEVDVVSRDYLTKNVKEKIDLGIDIKSFWKDIVKDKEACFILTVVDDSIKNSGNKRNDILNKDNKYIGISSIKIGKSFACYIVIG